MNVYRYKPIREFAESYSLISEQHSNKMHKATELFYCELVFSVELFKLLSISASFIQRKSANLESVILRTLIDEYGAVVLGFSKDATWKPFVLLDRMLE